MINLKRIYDSYDPTDGLRILVDRLWPRGLSKEKARVDLWIKEIAPSNGLRQWFGHNPEKWQGFKKKYLAELKNNQLLEEIEKLEKKYKKVTLLYAAKDEMHNQAVILKEAIHK